MLPFPLTGEERLQLTAFNAQAAVRLALTGRVELPDGRISPFTHAHTPNTDRTISTEAFDLGPGRLLEVQAFATAGTPRRGQCFVMVELVRGRSATPTPLAALIQGYVTDTQRRGWPASALELSTIGPGMLRSITGTDPAANVEISETVPTNARWRLLSLIMTLVTDANVANRDVSLTLDDGATVYARIPGALNVAASLTTRFAWSPYQNRFVIAQDRTQTVPLPDLWLPGGHRIKTVTTNLQATDNYGAPQLLVEELIED